MDPLCLHPDPHHHLGNHTLGSNLQHINGGRTAAESTGNYQLQAPAMLDQSHKSLLYSTDDQVPAPMTFNPAFFSPMTCPSSSSSSSSSLASSSSSSSTTSPLPVSPYSGLLPATNFFSPINSHQLMGAASSGLKSDYALDYDQLLHQFDPILMHPHYSTSVDQQLLQSPLSDCPLSKINPLFTTSTVSSTNPNENSGTANTVDREMKPSSTGAVWHQTIVEERDQMIISGANSSYAPYSLSDYPFAATNFLHNLVDMESLVTLEPSGFDKMSVSRFGSSSISQPQDSFQLPAASSAAGAASVNGNPRHTNVQASATMASDHQCRKSSSSDESMCQPESSTMPNGTATKYKAQAHQPATKRSRKSQQKRVIRVPATGGLDRPTAECLPSDSWAWRKYGQKPIKGTPYPRSYYKCSSFKGCPGRKQVERSPTDPSMLLITYTSDHNHGSGATTTNTSSTTSATTDLPTNPSSLASQVASPELSSVSCPTNVASEDSSGGPPLDSEAIPSLSSLIDDDDDHHHGNDGIHDDHVVNSPPTSSDQEVEDNQPHNDVISSQELQHSTSIDDSKVINANMPSSLGCHHMNGRGFDGSLSMGNHHYHMHVKIGPSIQYVDKQEEELFAQLEELSDSFSFFEDPANRGTTVDPFSLYNWSSNISPTW